MLTTHLELNHLIYNLSRTDGARVVKHFVPGWTAGRLLHSCLFSLAEQSQFADRMHITAL